MTCSVTTICGVQVGFEFTDGFINDKHIGYLLIDLAIIRIQFAWYINKGE
jgi:hypothetical protein